MNEHQVVFSSGGLSLSGTVTVGEGTRRSACVLLIPGSGQVDRDENHKRLKINVFAELAVHLAEHGIDSLRYDKRGVGQSEGDFWATGMNDNAADVAAAIHFVRTHDPTDRDRLFLLGHSEGAYLATMVAAKTPDLAGVILLAGGARKGEDELRWQAQQVAAGMTGFNALLLKLLRIDVVKAQQKQLDKIKRTRKDWYRAQLVAKVNAKWMREFLEYDPSGDLSRIAAPILAITGAKDIQVDPGNLERMETLVDAPFERHVVPDVTHLLRADPGRPSLSTYKDQVKKPVAPEVVDIVSGWLEQRLEPASV